jgi:hypothetical protein
MRNRVNCFCEVRKNKPVETLTITEIMAQSYVGRLKQQNKNLKQQLTSAKEEISSHLKALEVSKNWHTVKPEITHTPSLDANCYGLLEVMGYHSMGYLRFDCNNQKQELLDKIQRLEREIEQLKKQQTQLTAQIEINIKESKK